MHFDLGHGGDHFDFGGFLADAGLHVAGVTFIYQLAFNKQRRTLRECGRPSSQAIPDELVPFGARAALGRLLVDPSDLDGKRECRRSIRDYFGIRSDVADKGDSIQMKLRIPIEVNEDSGDVNNGFGRM